jgi:hypothetical protein
MQMGNINSLRAYKNVAITKNNKQSHSFDYRYVLGTLAKTAADCAVNQNSKCIL